jgi:hypothetical protein
MLITSRITSNKELSTDRIDKMSEYKVFNGIENKIIKLNNFTKCDLTEFFTEFQRFKGWYVIKNGDKFEKHTLKYTSNTYTPVVEECDVKVNVKTKEKEKKHGLCQNEKIEIFKDWVTKNKKLPEVGDIVKIEDGETSSAFDVGKFFQTINVYADVFKLLTEIIENTDINEGVDEVVGEEEEDEDFP